jgi:hypothetical protein
MYFHPFFSVLVTVLMDQAYTAAQSVLRWRMGKPSRRDYHVIIRITSPWIIFGKAFGECHAP